jgi:hypothetical protein
MSIPLDPFLKDAQGAGRWALDILRRYGRKSDLYDPAIYWAARWACHWARKSKAYQEMCVNG